MPKQFIEINGQAILHLTLKKFHAAIPNLQIVIAIHGDYMDYWKNYCNQHGIEGTHTAVVGGEERFHSIKNALVKMPKVAVVGVHDAVRPLVSEKTILDAYEDATKNGSAIPVVPISQSLRMMTKEGGSVAVNRDDFKIVQTPQCFQHDLIQKAYEMEYNPAFTDDASVVEAAGYPIHLTAGNQENLKITSPIDMEIAKSHLER